MYSHTLIFCCTFYKFDKTLEVQFLASHASFHWSWWLFYGRVGMQRVSHFFSFAKTAGHGFTLLEIRGHAGTIEEVCLKPEGMWYHPNDITQGCLVFENNPFKEGVGSFRNWNAHKIFQSSSEYSKLNRMCILINFTIIPGNTAKDSTS